MTNDVLKTIYGKAKFCYLSTPDEFFGSEYKVTLEVPQEKAQEHIKAIEDIIKYQVAEEHKARPNQTSLLKRAPKHTLMKEILLPSNYTQNTNLKSGTKIKKKSDLM